MTHFIAIAILGTAIQDNPVPLFSGTGVYSRNVGANQMAQKYFDQGLNMLFAFHHGEAKRSFREAIRLDPKCAMAYWGLATALGPHINFPMVPPEEEKEAFEAIRTADSLGGRTKSERALIAAAMHRFHWPQPESRSDLDKAYANQMRLAWKANPKDADIGALFAESLMDLRPWDLWTHAGKPQPGTLEVVSTLERTLKLSPNHPLALHLHIHAVEASPSPERAVPSANRLRFLQPGLGHNVHMPSHTYVRVGMWQEAIDANARAMAADKEYREHNNVAPLYRMYMAHNNHMLAFAAMMTGQSKVATKAVDDMVAAIPQDVLNDFAPIVDGFFAMPIEVRVRFGKWDEVLEMPLVTTKAPLGYALCRGARAVAYAAKGMIPEARAEQSLFFAAKKNVPADSVFGNNKGSDLLTVATHLVNGEILVAEGRWDDAVTTLRLGINAEDALRYSEPPDWIQPVRHTLGALLIKRRMFNEAINVYTEDLKRLPGNGWALFGMAEAYEALGKAREAGIVRTKFERSWKNADAKINSSCLCIPPSAK